MKLTDRFTADKTTIRADLEKRARTRRTITYGEAAALVSRTALGLGKTLTAIDVERRAHDMPNLGALVVTVRTGLPSNVKADPAHRARAITMHDEVWRP